MRSRDMNARQAARAIGATRYFTGIPCRHGHVCERMVSTCACVTCLTTATAAWRANNPEKVNAQKRAWCNANLEKARALRSAEQKRNRANANERNRRYCDRNRDKVRAGIAAWAKANPGRCLAKSARRRARELQAVASWADHDLINSMYELARVYNDHTPLDVHVDHVVPLQGKKVCGLHVHNNLQIIDAYQNRAKSNRFNIEGASL